MIFLLFSIEIFVKDEKNIEKILRNYIEDGYLDAYSYRKNDSTFIEKGKRYYIGNISLQSPVRFDYLLFNRFYMKPFSKRNVSILTDSINFYFADHGFPFNEIIPEFSIYDSIINIDFNVILKNLCIVKKITISDNIKNNKNILKEIHKLTDLTYSRKRLIDEIKKINSSNIIKVDSFKLKEEDEGISIILFVSNVSYGDISGGMSFQSENGWNLNFSGHFFNPFGLGTIWKIKFERNSGEKSFSLKGNLPLFTPLNNFYGSYTLIISSDTLIKNNLSFKHIYKIQDYKIGNGLKYSDESSEIRKRFILYNLLLGYRKSYLEIFTDFKREYILLLKTLSEMKSISFSTISCFTSENMKDEENFFSVIRGYPYTYNKKIISSSVSYNFFNKSGYKFYSFFDFNVYPYFTKKYSVGFGLSKDRFNVEIAYPIGFGIRNIMLVFRFSPVDFFDNP